MREVEVEFTRNCLMSFHDPKTGRTQWYCSDMFRGEKTVFSDVVSASPTKVTLVCLDGEHAKVPVDAIRFI